MSASTSLRTHGEGRCSPRRLGWWDTDLIDEAGARARLSVLTAPPDVRNIEDKMAVVKKEKECSV